MVPEQGASTPEGVAFHEAGHVVVGHLLGLTVRSADTRPDGVGGFGHTTFEPIAPAEPAPDMAGSGLEPPRAVHDERVLVTFLAGLAAESRHAGRDMVESAGYDLDELAREWLPRSTSVGEETEAAIIRLRREAEALVSRPEIWRAIEAVAAALLRHGEIDGAEAERLVRESIAGDA